MVRIIVSSAAMENVRFSGNVCWAYQSKAEALAASFMSRGVSEATAWEWARAEATT